MFINPTKNDRPEPFQSFSSQTDLSKTVKRLRNAITGTLAIVCWLFSSITVAQVNPDGSGIAYVTQDGTGDGHDWDNATNDLQGAINSGAMKVFVAVGEYKVPTPHSFVMKDGVAIYGGFDPDKDIRTLSDARILPTFDGKGSILNGRDERPVIWSQQEYNEPKVSFLLDAFTITGGRVQNGLMIGSAIHLRYTVPTLTNLIIKDNHGGMSSLYIESSASASTKIQNIALVDNVLDNTEIHSANSAIAVVALGNYTFDNLTIANNVIPGIDRYNTLIDRHNAFYTSATKITLRNSIILGRVNRQPGDYVSDHSIIPPQYSWDNGEYGGSNGDIILPPNTTTDDIFTNASTGDYTLKPGSPAINAGSNASFAGLTVGSADLHGNPRVHDYATGGIIDLGASESPYVGALSPTPDANGIIYVMKNSAGNGSGNSWENALSNLATAISTQGVQKVFVAAGSYYVGGSSFMMKNNVAIYGGFDPEHHIKTLDDSRIMPDPADAEQGSVLNGQGLRPVIWNVFNAATAMDNTAILDGFTVTGGKSGNNGTGGGIYNEYASPTLSNLVISNSYARFGGGVYNKNSSPKMENIHITGNTVQWDGGGIYNKESSPILLNIKIAGNKANYGGGVFNQTSANPTMVNVLITGNRSDNDAGGMYNDAASIPVVINGTLSDNTGANEIYNRNASVSIRNSIVFGEIAGDAPTIQYSLIEGTFQQTEGANSGNRVLAALPGDVFTDPNAGDYSLKNTSPAVDAGSNGLFPGLDASSKDLAGSPRLVGTTIDLGAYENQDGELPVRWISFLVRLDENHRAILDWKVDQSEVSRYEVERSSDALDFRTIGFLTAGSGQGSAQYRFTDPTALTGTVYYRIRQIDLDGTYNYSRIVSIAAADHHQLFVYPNPATGKVNVGLGPEYIGSKLKLISVSGIELQQFTVSGEILTFDLGKYPSGMYLLHTFDRKVVRLIKE